MGTSEAVAPDTVEATAYHAPPVTGEHGALVTGLEAVPGLSVRAVRPLAEYDPEGDHDGVVVVAGDRLPADPVAAPLVCVTTDADVARTAAERGAAGVVGWRPGDDPDLLATQVERALADRHGSRVDDRVLDSLEDPVFELDADHRILAANDAGRELFGTGQAVRGERFWDVVPRSREGTVESAIERVTETGESVTETVELADGVGLFDVTVHPTAEGVVLHGRPPQEETGGRSLYEYLVETVGDAVYILDDDGNFVFVNDALCEMTGYDRGELLGSSVHVIKDHGTVAEAEDALRELLKRRAGPGEGIDIVKLDVELVTKDGERIPCTDRMTLRPLEDGTFTGTVGTLRDVSRQRRRQNILGGIVDKTREMMTATETAAVAELVVETATDVFDLDLAAVRKFDPERGLLVPVATSAAVDSLLGDRPDYRPDEGPAGTAYTEGELLVREAFEDVPSVDEETVETAAYVPIGDQYVLSLGRTDRRFTDDERRFLEVLANTAAAAFDRVQREENLRQYEAILEAAEDKLFTLDDDGLFTLVTRPFAEMVGYEREQLVGRPVAELVPEWDIEAATADVQGPVTRETTLARADGERVPSRLTLAPFAGSFESGLVGTVRDISQLRSAQEEASRQRRRFTELFETLSDPVADVRYDGEATVAGANPAFAALCDTSPDALQETGVADVRAMLPDGLADALAPVTAPDPAVDTEVTVQGPAGERHYLVRTVPYEGDETDRAFVVCTDVTEVKQRGTHLKVLHRLLRHNLRNETAIIKGHAEQVRDLDPDAQVDDHLEQIMDASTEMVEASETARTIQEVLGMDADAVESLPVERVVDRIEQELATADADGVTVDADGASGRVVFSRYLLTGVVELVDNAIEHAADPTVTVELREDDAGATIAVADDGPGLPRSQWDLLMGDREITQLQHSEGLGLWLVKWLTDRHGGQLRLVRADETGTTVAIDLPERLPDGTA